MYARWEEITPARAQELLDKHTNFRTADLSLVDRYGRDMKGLDGRVWHKNGESIKIPKEGSKAHFNGMHRCMACVKYQVSFYTLVVYDIEDDEGQDENRKRTAAQYLRTVGVRNATDVAAAVRVIWRYRFGTIDWVSSAVPLSNVDVKDYATKACAGIEEWVGLMRSVRFGGRVVSSVGALAAMFYLTAQVAPVEARAAMNLLTTGDLKNNAAHKMLMHIRRILAENAALPSSQRKSSVELAALLVKALNGFRENKFTKLQVKLKEASNQESFPSILGLPLGQEMPSVVKQMTVSSELDTPSMKDENSEDAGDTEDSRPSTSRPKRTRPLRYNYDDLQKDKNLQRYADIVTRAYALVDAGIGTRDATAYSRVRQLRGGERQTLSQIDKILGNFVVDYSSAVDS